MAYNTSNPSKILKTLVGIDGKTAATTTGYAVPSGKTVIVTGYVVRVSAEDTITVVGQSSIKTSGLQTVMSTTVLTGLNSTAKAFIANNSAVTVAATAGTIDFVVDVGFTATTATLEVDIIGYLI